MLSKTRASHAVYAALIAPIALLLVFASYAGAAIVHPYTGTSFGPGGVGSGSFGFVRGVTVDQRNGDVLVYDASEGGRVYKFDAAGEPVDFSSTGTNAIEGVGGSGVALEIAVDSSSSPDAGDIYVANGSTIQIYAESGASLGELNPGSGMCGVAVDPSGNVYAASFGTGQVTRFAPSTSPVTTADEYGAMGGTGACNLAVDGAGDVYTSSIYGAGVSKYEAMQFGSLSASGTLVDSSGNGSALALDGESEELFVDELARIVQYDTSIEPPHFQGASGSSGSGALASSYGVGVDQASGELYAGDDTAVEIFGAGVTVAGASIQAATEVTNTAAALHGSVEPEGGELTSCVFEYGTETGVLSSSVPCEPAAPYTGTTSIPISARLSGLQPNTRYYYRIAAVEAGGALYSLESTLWTTAPPTIAEEAARHVGSSSVTLSAQADDYRASATYRFEYGTTSAYGSSTPSKALASLQESQLATATLNELQPGATYHFRLVVEGQGGDVRGPDYIFTTKPLAPPALTLPDGRVYEKVSPNDNANGNVYQDNPLELATESGWTLQPFVVSPNGSAIAYMGEPSELGGTGLEGGGYGNQYVARRLDGGGWSASNVDPASATKKEQSVYLGFSSDLSVGFVQANTARPLAEGAPGERFRTLYARAFGTGSYEALTKGRPANRGSSEFTVAYAGSSADLSHELFAANDALTANAVYAEEGNNLYDASGGTTTLVNVLPDGSSEPNATFGGPPLPWTAGKNTPMLGHDISENGSRIFWTDLNSDDLYVRENDTAPQSPLAEGRCTVPTDACTVLIAEDAQFWNASSDGSKVLYTKSGDLYEYDASTRQSIDLAPGGSVNGVVAASEDLSYVYFVAKAALAPGAEPVSCIEGESPPEASHCNLYAIHVGESPRFIGALAAGDNYGAPESYSYAEGDWQGSLGSQEAEVTPDGMHLMFVSKANLTGYESDFTGQVFMYDFPTGQLGCLSCKPDGEAMEVGGQTHYSAYLPVSMLDTRLPQWMSDDGNRVFFDSVTALVSQDTNNKTDVYEWERDGSGSCTKSPGCIYLLSDGTSSEGSYLIGASENGDDVFFTTRGKLVPEDENEDIDVYDARAGAVQPPVAPKCTGTGCQGVASAPPIFATPPSVTYNGVGNFEAPAPTPTTAKAKSKPLTRAQKLARALKACRKKANKKRTPCERQARAKYGAKRPSPKKRGNAKKTSRRGK